MGELNAHPKTPSGRHLFSNLLVLMFISPLKTHEPGGIVTFAFKLAHAISAALESVIEKGEEALEKAREKMFLYECAREVLAGAMRLLSIKPLERMCTRGYTGEHNGLVLIYLLWIDSFIASLL